LSVFNVAAAFFVEQLQRQQAEQRGLDRDHPRTGMVGGFQVW
jgi:hypothetical protein